MYEAHFGVLSYRFVIENNIVVPIHYRHLPISSGRKKRINRFMKCYSKALKLHGYLRRVLS